MPFKVFPYVCCFVVFLKLFNLLTDGFSFYYEIDISFSWKVSILYESKSPFEDACDKNYYLYKIWNFFDDCDVKEHFLLK